MFRSCPDLTAWSTSISSMLMDHSNIRVVVSCLALASVLMGSLGCAAAAHTLRCEPMAAGRADEAGVDRHGHLWVWDREGSTLRWLDVDGQLVEVVWTPKARWVDADREWGITAVGPYGASLQVVRPGATEPALELRLPDEAATVAWIDRNRVAVAPTRADSLVELWDLSKAEPVRALGQGHRIEATLGATFLRVLVLDRDPAGESLLTLDSLRGTLRRLTLDGAVTLEMGLEADRLPELEAWRREVDRQAREADRVQTPLYWVLDLHVGANGSAYVVERCSEERTRVTWVRVSPDGGLERTEQGLNAPVCSLDFTRWHDAWIFLAGSDGEPPRAHRCHEPTGEESS